MTTPDYVEASLTLAPDGVTAPVFHMVRLPDSVVFVEFLKVSAFLHFH